MNYNQPDLKAQVFPPPYHTMRVLLIHSQDTHSSFHWPETGCGEEDSSLSGTSRKAHAVHSHMTCCSLWKSLCVPEREGGVKWFLSASPLLGFNTHKKWTAMPDQRHQQRHKCYQVTSKRQKFQNVFALWF